MTGAGITISGRQRNLLFKPILDFLESANDVYFAAKYGKYEEAFRLGLQTGEELTFLLGDLGLEEMPEDEVVHVRTSALIVRNVVGRILEGARNEVFEGSQAEIRKLEKETGELLVACEEVLAALPPEDKPETS